MQLPEQVGVLMTEDLQATVDAIALVQQADGSIPWYPGGQMDPWNHVEAAMALCLGGRLDVADRAYDWLRRHQRPEGAWHAYYEGGGVKDVTFDSNVTAYIATGAWHRYLATGDRAFLYDIWPVIERTIELCVSSRRPRWALARRVAPPGGRGTRSGLLAAGRHAFLRLRAPSAVPRCWARSAPGGPTPPSPRRTRSDTSRRCSSTSGAGPWTGTTPCSVA